MRLPPISSAGKISSCRCEEFDFKPATGLGGAVALAGDLKARCIAGDGLGAIPTQADHYYDHAEVEPDKKIKHCLRLKDEYVAVNCRIELLEVGRWKAPIVRVDIST